MKKILSIVFLLVFFLFHTGRILLYLECKLSNSITTASCDCVKILSENTQDTTIPVNNHSNHKHLPEEFELYTTVANNSAAAANTAAHNSYLNFNPQDFTPSIFHPPLVV